MAKVITKQAVTDLDVFGIEECAQYMGVNPRTIYQLLRAGQLVGRRIGVRGKTWKIHRDAVRDYLMAPRKPPLSEEAPGPARKRRA